MWRIRLVYSGNQIKNNEINEHVACMGQRVGAYRFWWGHLRGRDKLEDSGVCRVIILKWIFRKWDGVHELD